MALTVLGVCAAGNHITVDVNGERRVYERTKLGTGFSIQDDSLTAEIKAALVGVSDKADAATVKLAIETHAAGKGI